MLAAKISASLGPLISFFLCGNVVHSDPDFLQGVRHSASALHRPARQKLVTRLSPTLLPRKQVAKPWGRSQLPAPFGASSSERVGEIWLDGEGLGLDLLVKYLFTSEKLSIQVHPSDELARKLGLPSGKEECWIVVDAEPGATLGIGTRVPLSPEQLRAAALDGSIEQLMEWKPVARGDVFYIPAGTVHAIGAGVSIIEVQQRADVTYRIYDYGRPRELHLDEASLAAVPAPYDDSLQASTDFVCEGKIVSSPKFDVWIASGWPAEILSGEPVQIVPLSGEACIEGVTASSGDCLVCNPGAGLNASPDFMAVIAQAKVEA